jgi:hypothetical protein
VVRRLGPDDAVWSPTTFTKNRDRLLSRDISASFFDAIFIHAHTARLLSYEHFTVEGTLLEAWASPKSFRRGLRIRSRTAAAIPWGIFMENVARTSHISRRPTRRPLVYEGRWP